MEIDMRIAAQPAEEIIIANRLPSLSNIAELKMFIMTINNEYIIAETVGDKSAPACSKKEVV